MMLLMLDCIVAVAISPCCSALSEGIYSSQLVSSPLTVHFSCQTVKKCPTWFFFSSTTCDCQCLPYYEVINCDGNNALIKIGFIVTYNCDENRPLISTDHWQHYKYLTGHVYNITKPGYILLPSDITALNDYMCAPLHRNGFLCSKCKDGFGPSISVMEILKSVINVEKHGLGLLFISFLSLCQLQYSLLSFWSFVSV